MADTNYVKFLRGTAEQYAKATKNSDTLYFIMPSSFDEGAEKVGSLYLGDVLLAGNLTDDGSSVVDTLAELKDVDLSSKAENSLLGYDGEKWVPMTIEEAMGSSVIKSTQVFEITIEKDADHISAITTEVGDKELQAGDIAIVKENIVSDDDTLVEYTSYVYNGTAWAAMDGNYSAENVYMSNDLTITANVGVQTVGSSGSTTVATKGKNIKQVFDTLFAAEKDPTATVPSVSAVSLSGAGTKEVGTTISPSYSCSFSAGSYTYGPATGITAQSWSIKDSKGNTATTSSGTFDSFKIAEGEIYNVTATATYNEGAIPVTNLGNACEAKKIAAGTTAAKTSASFTGYRQGYFIGTLTTKTDGSAITSDIIRGLSMKKNSAYEANKKVTLNVSAGAATIVIACPNTKTGMADVLNTTVNANMTTSFSKTTVKVAGADNDPKSEYAAEYNVWTFSPAEAYSSAATLQITLG